MLPNYQVRFKDHNGTVTHVLAGHGSHGISLRSIQFENIVNGCGSHAIRIQGDLNIAEQLGLDYQVEVWYKPTGATTWVLRYGGLHRTWTWQADSNGGEEFTSYGTGYNNFLARRIIAAYAGTSGAEKSGAAETVIKAYVDENAGPGAIVARQIKGLTIEADTGRGNAWTGSRAWANLLEVCQDLAYAGGGDFNVVSTGAATYEFRWYATQLGQNRTLGNVGGLDPVIFSPQRNNMLTPVLSYNYGQEFNYVYVLGQGEGTDRTVIGTSNSTSMIISPWNRIEVARQATNESTAAGLASVGAEELMNGAPSRSASFEVLQTPGCLFGVHYNLGDIVTALYRQRVDKKIIKVAVIVDNDKESTKLELSDVAR